MTLSELMNKEKFKNVKYVAVWDQMDPDSVYPDFTDEYLETHGDYEVMDYEYLKDKDVMVVELVDLN